MVPTNELTGPGDSVRRLAVAFATSGVVHVVAVILLVILAWRWDVVRLPAAPAETVVDVRAPERPDDRPRLDNEDIGRDPAKATNYNVDRIETVSVPGAAKLEDAVGIEGAAPAPPQTIAPPPGVGGGQGGGLDAAVPGPGSPFGAPGGFLDGRFVPGQFFGGRSGATRERMLAEGGGSAESEAAVARGLKWLKSQQKENGRWVFAGNFLNDDYGATGLALLPFLGAGYTHRPNPDVPDSKEFVKTVDLGLRWLLSKQHANGLLGPKESDGISKHYSHAICTMVLCEAFALSKGDPALRGRAQKALDYLVKAQHSGGGFRYAPGEPGDTSVTAWCLQALQSGKLAGLTVPKESLDRVGKFLDGVQVRKGAGYGYLGPAERPNLNLDAAGLLCRAYLGWGPRHPAMLAGIEKFKDNLPAGGANEIYYYYYATQVMHFCATPEDWKGVWNPKMRDQLIKSQDASTGPNRGSWAPERSMSAGAGGRLYQTSLSLLTLEVYYRHLPLYNLNRK